MFLYNLRRPKAETLLCGSRAAQMCNRVSTHVNTEAGWWLMGAGWRLMEALLSLQQVEREEGPTDGEKARRSGAMDPLILSMKWLLRHFALRPPTRFICEEEPEFLGWWSRAA